jgi:hypothetical protein
VHIYWWITSFISKRHICGKKKSQGIIWPDCFSKYVYLRFSSYSSSFSPPPKKVSVLYCEFFKCAKKTLKHNNIFGQVLCPCLLRSWFSVGWHNSEVGTPWNTHSMIVIVDLPQLKTTYIWTPYIWVVCGYLWTWEPGMKMTCSYEDELCAPILLIVPG